MGAAGAGSHCWPLRCLACEDRPPLRSVFGTEAHRRASPAVDCRGAVVRHGGRSMPAAPVQRPVAGLAAAAVRKLSAFDEAVLLCDVRAKGWPIRFVNSQWCNATGGRSRATTWPHCQWFGVVANQPGCGTGQGRPVAAARDAASRAASAWLSATRARAGPAGCRHQRGRRPVLRLLGPVPLCQPGRHHAAALRLCCHRGAEALCAQCGARRGTGRRASRSCCCASIRERAQGRRRAALPSAC